MSFVKLAAIAAVVVPCAAHAVDTVPAEIMPQQGVEHIFGTTSVLTYYVAAKDGLHLIATMNNVNGDPTTVFRFVVVLADSQQVVMSRPRVIGEMSEEIVFRRDGDHLLVLEPEEFAIRN